MKTYLVLFFVTLISFPIQSEAFQRAGEEVRILPRTSPTSVFLAIGPNAEKVELPLDESSEVQDAWVHYGRLVVVGRLNIRAFEIQILDLGTKARDVFWTWRFGVSPSGRYLALESFIPATTPPIRRCLVTVYDLERGGDVNRAAEMGSGFDRREFAGVPVYPEENLFLDSYKPTLAGDLEYFPVSPFLWLDDSRFFFLTQEGNMLYLIKVILGAAEAARIWRQQLDLEGLWQNEAEGRYFRKRLVFLADSLSWTPERKIKVDLDPDYGFGSSFELPVD